MTERDNLYFGVIAEIERLGFPHEFGAAVAQQLGGPKSLCVRFRISRQIA